MTDSTDNAPKRITHPHKGPDLPTEVFADPGRHDWYFREKMPDSVARFVRADLAPDPLGAVKVKPLVWGSGPLECVSILGKYHIGRIGCSWWLRLNNQEIDRGTSWSFEGSGEAAKAAAQADYETRIRSALEPDPQDARVKALVEAVNEAVCLLWEEMSKQGNVGTHGGYIYMKLRPALAAFDKGGKTDG